MTAEELLRYSFEALESWARDRGLPREPGETPLEFAGRIGEEFPALDENVRQVAVLYAAVAYSRRSDVTAASRDVLRGMWGLLRQVGGRSVATGV
jgi:hypothetical protein